MSTLKELASWVKKIEGAQGTEQEVGIFQQTAANF